ncbi:efflux RND transporter periplasmic adaptor subunit [Flavobacteriaceae bacterium]|jgi:HlyD family secretion protein|nr:efflux RND transporter periplasmic adaptor subunit [Flavobacteriaceae bacterium]MDA7808397.1 efflux RND transporter periplasmic adaptor subunit [Flavobacteriaceae bacterium]MDA8877663.1 efflux RND transporter periplasmic adaptor subunit [Flavobacteriaceae bacterium]MDA9852024.1 efflux RND transporter periplasmic adaptor subunit [Flavobacteriaceae bacterium]MDC0872663.1 efflux RND transporter periplasmic adaptor subunit [Flavobacteriaceae bacterium]
MKILKYIGIALLILGALFAAAFFIKTNNKSVIEYDTQTVITTSIEKKTVVTGKVIPEDEVEIKPQIQGIIDALFVEEGDQVNTGDLLAKIKVVPNEQNLNSAEGRLANSRIVLKNAEIELNRNKDLFEKGIISKQNFENVQLRFNQAKQDVSNSISDLQIIRSGSKGGAASANTNIRATVPGTVLEIPVEEGFQVIASNSFNAGTTIATIADLNKMIFEGKVDEAEVGKLRVGMPLEVSLGAIEDQALDARLKFIAPKGNEEQGAVQFIIEADLFLNDSIFVRAGYSANASLVLERKDSIMAIPEALLQFDRETEKPYVEVQVEDQKFERRDIEIGISDGVNVEVISGLTKEDQIKVWNKTEPIKKGDEEESSTENN